MLCFSRVFRQSLIDKGSLKFKMPCKSQLTRLFDVPKVLVVCDVPKVMVDIPKHLVFEGPRCHSGRAPDSGARC